MQPEVIATLDCFKLITAIPGGRRFGATPTRIPPGWLCHCGIRSARRLFRKDASHARAGYLHLGPHITTLSPECSSRPWPEIGALASLLSLALVTSPVGILVFNEVLGGDSLKWRRCSVPFGALIARYDLVSLPYWAQKRMERKAEMEIPLIPESENDERRKCWDEVSGEVKKLIVLAAPLSFVNLLLTSLQFISIMFVGNYRGGELSLSGASMATSFASVTGYTLTRGFAGALDTLCGQSYGAKQYKMLGIFMQRGMLVMLLICIPVAGVWAYTDRILRLCGTDPEISNAAGEYARFLIPSIFPFAILRCLVSFLQAQNNVVPMMFTAGIGALVHVLSCWILVFKSGMGFNGAAMANAVSYWVNVVLLGVYVRVSPSCKETWTGFSMDMFHGIIKFLRLGIPSTAMLWWASSKSQAGNFSSLYNTKYMPLGLYAAYGTWWRYKYSVRVSNEVGGGRPKAAWMAVRTALGCAATEGILVGIAMVSVHKVWGYVFSTEEQVVNYAGKMLLLLSASHFLDSILCVLSGTARGCGWQNIGAIVNLGAHNLLGMPAGVLLAFVYHVGGKCCANLKEERVASLSSSYQHWEKSHVSPYRRLSKR
nr:protein DETOXIFICATION 16-like [Ipomoea batatas]